MPLLTADPVLHLQESSMCNIDPQNPSDLFGMWSAFSKCSGILENGKRLENLSWRLWNQQTFCLNPSPHSRNASTPANIPTLSPQSRDIPELSRSIDSVSSVASDSPNSSKNTSPDQERASFFSHEIPDKRKKLRDSTITQLDLEHLVISIKNKQDLTGPLTPLGSPPSSAPAATEAKPSSPRPVTTESSTSTVAENDCYNSPEGSQDSSATSAMSAHSVIRGFQPVDGASSYSLKAQEPIPTSVAQPTPILKSSSMRGSNATKQTRRNEIFMLGAASSEEESSFRERMSPAMRSNIPSATTVTPHQSQCSSKKQTSFNEHVSVIKTSFQLPRDDSDDAVFEDTDGEDDSDLEEISESAIEDEDDDEEAWEDDEDSKDDSRELKFPRVDSKANLSSRRSMLTLMHEAERSSAMHSSRSTPALRRSRTSTPNGPSIPASPTAQESMMSQASMLTQSRPIPVATQQAPFQPIALSPRTTRRNMLAGELSESLRKQLLWERQQRNTTSTAAGLKRAYTSVDVRRAAQPPQPLLNTSVPKDSSKAVPWNQYFDNAASEYHQKGW